MHSGLLVSQSKYYQLRVQFRHGIIEAASRDGDHLAAARACEDEWRGASSSWKITLPQQLAGCCIEGANVRIDRSAYKDEAGVSSRRTAKVRQSGEGRSLELQFSERHAPLDCAFVGAHSDQLAPRRTSAGDARRGVEEFARHCKRGALLFSDFDFRTPAAFISAISARDHSNHMDPPIHRSNDQAIHRVPRPTAPMHPAGNT